MNFHSTDVAGNVESNKSVGIRIRTPTTTTLASSKNPSNAGDSVTFTATVTPSFGGLVPDGFVTFKDGATTLGTGTLAAGKATFTTSTLSGGSHKITGTYSGSSNFVASASSILTQVVTAATSTALASSVNPSVFGQSVTFTATVTSAAPGTITGTVTFKDGATTLGTGSVSGGVATFSTSSLALNGHSMTAVYGGNGSYLGSTSPVLTQTVNRVPTTTTVVSSVNPSTLGQSVTFTAKVAPTVGTAVVTGTVAFKDGATLLGNGTLAGGVATFTTTALAIGTHSIKANFLGNSNEIASISTALSQKVFAATSTALASSLNPSFYGQAVTFTATITSPTAGTITGTVKFNDGATTLATVAVSGGQAQYTTSTLPLHNHSMTAVYSGDPTYETSTSPVLTQTVNRVSTTTTVVSSLNPSNSGNSVTFTATVAPTAGTGVPNGSVTFKDGSTTLGTGTLAAGKATFTISTLAVGNHNITGNYTGSTNFIASLSAILVQKVQ